MELTRISIDATFVAIFVDLRRHEDELALVMFGAWSAFLAVLFSEAFKVGKALPQQSATHASTVRNYG